MRTGTIALAVALLSTALALAAPAAHAEHPCSNAETLHRGRVVSVGAFTGDCVGAGAAQMIADCPQVLWGFHGGAFGVGGHSGCEAFAYVSVPALLP